ncbi:hypothetical protein [Pedosphaera parvula]|uniref:Uncharacterized protein n=1 Tax=Pedosphaera parvula (strain Ellin514) TaxID=320771 RepID=B9XP40_PEDPL|nr:hypothetical protein [Pedosphaera parvula]EEF58396.1 hypothetical protein Cflav_PD6139 [Pedosphaera parvula Ellin514]
MKTTNPARIRTARFIAIGADILQIGLFPLFGEGFISPLSDALDVLVCVLLTWLVGWHFSFLPSFVVKVLPVADLVPTWTIAIFMATRQNQRPVAPKPVATVVYDNGPAQPQLNWPANQ